MGLPSSPTIRACNIIHKIVFTTEKKRRGWRYFSPVAFCIPVGVRVEKNAELNLIS
jgi:hypothetical protein